MRYLPWYAAGAAIVAALVTHLLVPAVTRLAVALPLRRERTRGSDQPGARQLRASEVPRLGGLAIVGGLGIAAGFAALAHWTTWGTRLTSKEMLALCAGTLLVFAIGLVDDLRGIGPGTKFLVEVAAASTLLAAGWSFHVLRLPFVGGIDLGVWGGVISLIWIVGVTNAINLIDGLDGLAGGVVAIISLSMLGYAALQGSPGSVVLMAATTGACLGFLRHNWEPARIFMGDSGALTLGFLLAAMSVHSALKAPAAVAILVPILALGVPVMDTLLVMAVRFLDSPRARPLRRFLRMFHADRQHLHHLLDEIGARRSHVVGLIYAVVVAFCVMALVVAVTGQTDLGIVLVAIEFLVIFGMRQLGRAALGVALPRPAARGPHPVPAPTPTPTPTPRVAAATAAAASPEIPVAALPTVPASHATTAELRVAARR